MDTQDFLNTYLQSVGPGMVQVAGIPVGSDPRLPMSQEDFSEMVHRLMDRNKSVPEALRGYGVRSIREGIQKGIFRSPPGV